MEAPTKRCPHCGRDLPAVAFARNAAKRDGLQCYCRACLAACYTSLRGGSPPRPAPGVADRRPAGVHYVDPETLKERRSTSYRLSAQRRFYRDDPRAPQEPWPDEPAVVPAPVAAD